MQDRFGRTINYMRISVTDRCNLRCRYCMPDGITKCSMQEILTYEEIVEIAGAAEDCGITRFKVTGGEPLVRRGVETLVRSLKELPLTEQVTLTTNGVLLEEKLPVLVEAGLDAVNISLDTTDGAKYRQITGSDSLPQENTDRSQEVTVCRRSCVQSGHPWKQVSEQKLTRCSFRAAMRKRSFRWSKWRPNCRWTSVLSN